MAAPGRQVARERPRPGRRDPSAAHRFVTSDGTALHVTSTGPADADVTVVLVHGWTLDHRSWDAVTAALPDGCAREDVAIRVLRYDHRGHGGSAGAGTGGATIAQLADDLAELLAAKVPAGPVVLAGHSMGGMTIMALAERHPELVRSRVAAAALVATSSCNMARLTLGLPGAFGAVAARTDVTLGRVLAGWQRAEVLHRSAVLQPFVRWLVFGKNPPRREVRKTAAQIGRAHPSSIAGFRGSIGEHDRRAALAVLRELPTAVLVGDRDRLCPRSHATVIAAELPDTDFALYPGAGHMLPNERPREVTDALVRLVRAVHGTVNAGR